MSEDHQWQSAAYVKDWIDHDMTRDDQRRPLLRRIAALLPATTSLPLRVLDVGGGYGALSTEVLGQRPDAHIVLHDYSSAMIGQARQRLSRFGQRVSYATADLTDPTWISSLGGPFDAAVSALALHNLGSPDIIQRVYHDLYTLLRPGGCMFNLDLLFPTGPAQADLYRRDPTRDPRWDVHVSAIGLDAHLTWLRNAGFAEADCIWKDLDQGLLWGLRPS